MEGSVALHEYQPSYFISYDDPDISYRDLIVEISVKTGSIEVIFIKCSDEARITINEGSTERFRHNFAGDIVVETLTPAIYTQFTFKVIDRASVLVPKSASTACTDFSRFVFLVNITVILFVITVTFSTLYLLIYKRDQLRNIIEL